MRYQVYGAKGGVGCTTVAVLLARMIASDDTTTVLLESLAGYDDRCAVLGLPDGSSKAGPLRFEGEALHQVVDVGTNHELLVDEGRRVLVLRNDYLSLRRANLAPAPDVAVVLEDPAASLTLADVQEVLNISTAPIRLDPSVARSIDAGTLWCRTPTRLTRQLRYLLWEVPVS